ncbi:hypothetical protein H4696_008452 [Amycolatopsis lexingtonensis]|uniref:Uncharacterized protein n=1 Tax=Amycolatopsis lexingtonensis TaxID=218822 RepID=A0ABR9IEH1_9PSEU|nr:hypothetical protein [Amycolatopsis lexingtonensis]MBE1501352.1 hypothetical protein [Amycolatopsis lexingtonensis]
MTAPVEHADVAHFVDLATAWARKVGLEYDLVELRAQIGAALDATQLHNPKSVRVAGYVRIAELIYGPEEKL